MEIEEKKETKVRSRLYPRYDLEDSIKFIESVSKLGGNRVSNQAVAAEVGKAVNNSTFIGRISSSKQFGLLIQENGKLSLSSIGKEIMFPRGEEEKLDAIRTAFSSPSLYRELIDTFNGKVIPDQVSLGNRLVHDYKIEGTAKDSASRNFINSAQFAGVLQKGILVVSKDDKVDGNDQDIEEKISKKSSFDLFENFINPKSNMTQSQIFNDSGEGWTINIKSVKPLNSEVKKKLIDVSEGLDKINQKIE